MNKYRYKKEDVNHLFHETSLSIAISILLGIELVHQAWLSAGGASRSGRSSSGSRASGGRCTKVSAGAMRTMSSVISFSQRSGTAGTSTAKRTTNSLWLALESISALLTTAELSTLALELVHGDGWELGSIVVLSLVLVDLMDWNGGVDDGRLDSLLLDDRLDILVHMVVDVLAGNGGVGRLGVLGLANCTGILELGGLGSELLLDVVVVAVLDVAVLDADHVVGVLLGESLLVLDGLD